MPDITSLNSSIKTPFTFRDNSRPLVMADADNIFKRLQFEFGSTAGDALFMASTVADILTNTKASELDQIWTQIEKKLNKGKPIRVKAKSDEAKLNTAFGFLYSALNVIDSKAVDGYELGEIRNLFYDVDLKVSTRFIAKMTGTDKRVGLAVSKTTSERLDAVVSRFNELIEAGAMPGPEL